MAKFQLQGNEILVGSRMMAYQDRQAVTSASIRGTIYVTNQHVCFDETWSNKVYMDLSLSLEDILG